MFQGGIVVRARILGAMVFVAVAGAGLMAQTLNSHFATPLEYYQGLTQAGDLMGRGQFDRAADIYERAVAFYQDDGLVWVRLGDCLQHLNQYAAAARAYEKADGLGVWEPAWSAYRIARTYAMAKDGSSAMRWLKRAVELGYERRSQIRNDPAFSEWRNDPSFQAIAGTLPKHEFTRVEGWRYDLAFLVAEIRRSHYLYRSQPLPEAFVQAVKALNDDIPHLSDERITLELQALTARLGDGHSILYFFAGPHALKTLPLRWYLFSDGLYIIDAPDDLKQWIGSRVEKIGNFEPQEVLRRIDPYLSKDNPMFLKAIGMYFLLAPDLLQTVGVIPSAAEVDLTVKDREGVTRHVLLRPGPMFRLVKYLTPSELPGAPPPPLYQRRANEAYWFEQLPESKTVYCQFNQVLNRPEESLADFAVRLRRYLDEKQIQSLIVDVRHNIGGDATLLTTLLRTLIHFETTRDHAKLFVITGRTTFSAAQIFISQVEHVTNAIFVGEPSSSRPNFVGEDTPLVLPYSGILGSISTRYHQTNGMDHRGWIAPKIPAELSSGDYFANRDPSMAAIMALIKSGR